MNNRLWSCKNPHQGEAKKLLCVCSAGFLCSLIMANVLHQNYGYNTRAAGIDNGQALITVDDALIEWADEIVIDEERMKKFIETEKHVISLDIPDCYGFMDDKLVEAIKLSYSQKLSKGK